MRRLLTYLISLLTRCKQRGRQDMAVDKGSRWEVTGGVARLRNVPTGELRQPGWLKAQIEAEEIAHLPELEEATGELLNVLAYIFADYDIMTDEDADDWPELREALARVSVLLFPDEPEGEVEP